LRASLGLEPADLEARASVFAMVETARGVDAIHEICAVDGLTGVYVGPADLAISMGHGPAEAWVHQEVRETLEYIARTVTAAGRVAGIHASSGRLGSIAAQWGFQMITLASESQALRRGAAAHLAEAQGDTLPPRLETEGGAY
jgi:4-hydroxy-2-oxoheptanedioate aldolase